MLTRLSVLLFASACLSACSTPSSTEGPSGTESSDSESSSESSDSESSDTVPEPCTCVVGLDLVCESEPSMALYNCAPPRPCGTIHLENDPDPEVATCILQLLVDQQPSRFDYYDGSGFESWRGTFHILEPGLGVDAECYIYGDVSIEETPTAALYTINEPAYFQDCIGKTASVMSGCIFNGLTEMGLADECVE